MTKYLISFDDGAMTFPEEELPDVSDASLDSSSKTPLESRADRCSSSKAAAICLDHSASTASSAVDTMPICRCIDRQLLPAIGCDCRPVSEVPGDSPGRERRFYLEAGGL